MWPFLWCPICIFRLLDVDFGSIGLVSTSSVKSLIPLASACEGCSTQKKKEKKRNNNRPSLSSVRQFWEHNMVSGLGSSPHRDGGLIKPLTLGQRVKKKHACQLVHLPSKAYGANLIKCIGGRFQRTSTSLMWKIRPGCKNSNQTTVDSLGVIRAKEEPAAASSTASQSPPHAGRLLARPDRQKTRPDPFNSNGGFWALRNRRKTRRRENRPLSAEKK